MSCPVKSNQYIFFWFKRIVFSDDQILTKTNQIGQSNHHERAATPDVQIAGLHFELAWGKILMMMMMMIIRMF